MDTRTATQELEWNRLVAAAQERAQTQVGRDLLEALRDPENWAKTPAEANEWQDHLAQIEPYLTQDRLWNALARLPDPWAACKLLEKGGTLEAQPLGGLKLWIDANQEWIAFAKDCEIREGKFFADLKSLPQLEKIQAQLSKILVEGPGGEWEVSERASAKLAELHQDIRSTKRDISVLMDTLMKSYHQKGLLQDGLTDVRDGRYVLPVKISHQGDVAGMIFDASASKQTVFVEPMEVSPLNQKLRKRQNEILQEVFRILQEVSREMKPLVDQIRHLVEKISHWDSVAARFRLGMLFKGQMIQIPAKEKTFRLRRTAHPLLWFSLDPKDIIHNDIQLGAPAATLLLTGPNTGGKTVFLKTLGVAAIAARTGFPFPGSIDEPPVVPFFDAIFSDLGDSQSIEANLSSFSGHVARFRSILENLSGASLVLLDELNSATDPEEGAALGRAILETIMDRDAVIVSTTHDPKLKALSTMDPRILCASMAFDEKARVPTYRIVLGVPGRSRALETAERLGISKDVLEKARAYLATGHDQVEKLLAKLEADSSRAVELRVQAEAAFAEADRLKTEWTQKLHQKLSDTVEKMRTKIRDEVRSALLKLEDAKSRKDVDQVRAQAQTILEAEAPATLTLPKAPQGKIEVGSNVRIMKWKSQGVVLESAGSDTWKVQMGNMKLTLPSSELEWIAPKQKPGGQGRGYGTPEIHTPDSRLDLRGKRFEEAMSELAAYLDLAFRSRALKEVTIVHGYGTGALREGTRQMVSKLSYVKEFRDGGVGQGGTGATVIEFDTD
ncbi:MAG: Smr/MutS family protein [Bdellovibrionales bacterium]|nr:Smr/MutS family protein [Bdellovibrionales bacterium]